MRVALRNVYVYNTVCFECGKVIPIYFTLADFGDAPVLLKCKVCDTIYSYSPGDAFYQRSLNEQLQEQKCVRCSKNLLETLVPLHTHIKCCGEEFNLDDDYNKNYSYDGRMQQIETYSIY